MSSNAFYDEYEGYVRKYKAMYDDTAVVLLQCGHFYEMYSCFDGPYDKNNPDAFDIHAVAEKMNLAVTRKNKNIPEVSRSNCLMSGFPLHSLSKFLNVLTQSNYTVIVVSQVSPPPQPQRSITGIYSAGTMIDDVQPAETNYVMTIFCEEVSDMRSQKRVYSLGIAYIDVSTGKSFTCEIGSKLDDVYYAFDEAYRMILAVNPKEILLLGDGKHMTSADIIAHLDIQRRYVHDRYNAYDDSIRNLNYQNQFLKKIFPRHGLVSPVEHIDHEKHPLALCAFIAAVQFIYNHSESILERIEKPCLSYDRKYANLAYNTAKQLNILPSDQCQTCLVELLNHCRAAIGKRRFKEFLLNPFNDTETDLLERRYDDVAYFLRGAAYGDINAMLSDISDLERQFRKVLLRTLNPTEINSIKQSLSVMGRVLERTHDRETKLDRAGLLDLSSKFDLIDPTESSKYNLDDITGNVFVAGLYADIDEVQAALTEDLGFFGRLAKSLNELTETPGNAFFKVDYNDKDAFHLVITKKRFETFQSSNSKSKGATKTGQRLLVGRTNFDPDLMTGTKPSATSTSVKVGHPTFDLVNRRIADAKTAIKTMVTEKYLAFLRELCEYQSLFSDIVEYIGTIDYHCTNAYNAARFRYVRPTIDDRHSGKSYFAATGLRHPIVERIQNNVEYVANDVSLGTDGTDGLLLYGINAAGKSSLMKSIGICVIMASAGMYVPCSSLTFYPYRTIFTRIPSGDNIGRGQSTFTNEIGELRNIVKRADANSLVIGDELCSGTECISAMSIVSAGIITLSQRRSSFIFATHLHDLVNIPHIKSIANLAIKHLSVVFEEDGNKLVYDRKLKDGPGKTVYGLEVCKALDLDKQFLDIAHEVRRSLLKSTAGILSNKKTKYNAKLYDDDCYVCGRSSDDIHHIKPQNLADADGFIGSHHKNSLHNLIPVCKSCHDAIHDGDILVEGFVQTSHGVELRIRS